MLLRKFLITLFIFSTSFIFHEDVKAGCSRHKANIWINNLNTGRKTNISDGLMYNCGNIFKFNEGVKNDEISIRYWSCISNEGCGDFKKGYSAASLNYEDWIPAEISFSDYSNGLKSHILCIKQNDSVNEYCWRQGEYFQWEGNP